MKIGRWILLGSGTVFIIIILLAFTTLPYWMYHSLGTYGDDFTFEPEYIIVLGGDGMPSESNLMRCQTAVGLAKLSSESKVVLALPKDTSTGLQESSLGKMRAELILKGVDSNRIVLEPIGRNTRDQALHIAGKLVPADAKAVIVTSPEHMYRAIRVFRKAGMNNIGSQSSFNRPLVSELSLQSRKLGGRSLPADEIGNELQLRYQFWNHLKYQVLCYREYVAISYYYLRNWI